MTHTFDEPVISAVLHHMNTDHAEDNLLIARAFADEHAVGAVMSAFDGDGGDWEVTSAAGAARTVRVPWPSGPIVDRAAVRQEIVALYDESCRRLGVKPRAH